MSIWTEAWATHFDRQQKPKFHYTFYKLTFNLLFFFPINYKIAFLQYWWLPCKDKRKPFFDWQPACCAPTHTLTTTYSNPDNGNKRSQHHANTLAWTSVPHSSFFIFWRIGGEGFSLSLYYLFFFFLQVACGMRLWHSHTTTNTGKDLFYLQLKASSLKQSFNEVAVYSSPLSPKIVGVLMVSYREVGR